MVENALPTDCRLEGLLQQCRSWVGQPLAAAVYLPLSGPPQSRNATVEGVKAQLGSLHKLVAAEGAGAGQWGNRASRWPAESPLVMRAAAGAGQPQEQTSNSVSGACLLSRCSRGLCQAGGPSCPSRLLQALVTCGCSCSQSVLLARSCPLPMP